MVAMMMKTNDLKKGCRVQLTNGWYATIQDNAKGDTRMATVEGFVTETGTVYSHDIVRAEYNNAWVSILLTPKQTSLKHLTSHLGF